MTRTNCQECEGTGLTDPGSEQSAFCSLCDGRGWRYVSNIPPPEKRAGAPLSGVVHEPDPDTVASVQSAQPLSPEAEAAKSSFGPQRTIGVCSYCHRMISSTPCPHCNPDDAPLRRVLDDTVTLPEGGRHSRSPYRAELLPPLALLRVARILATGAEKYGIDNWKRIPIAVHIGRAQAHLLQHLAGDTSEDNLGNASCRVLFALNLLLELERAQQIVLDAEGDAFRKSLLEGSGG